MEKRIWSKPEMHEFAFAANEYVAACGDSGKTYQFQCDGESGGLFDGGLVYWYPDLDAEEYRDAADWSVEEWRTHDAQFRSIYTPCGEKHEAASGSGFYWGFLERLLGANGQHDEGETVIIWRGEKNNNTHVTKNLHINTWEIAKS
ncbi:MAG: hypothetical protein SPD88_10340 [Candidatus Ventricola sp.]|nr:hypothetical protein [Candidatus Ventricola sp.]